MKLTKFLAVLTLLLMLLGFQAPAWANPDPLFRWDFGGWSSPGGTNDFTIHGVPTSPAVDDYGTIYAGSMNGYFFAIYPDSYLKWVNVDLGFFTDTPAIADDGTIYAHNGYTLFALDPDNGWVKWSSDPICLLLGAPAIGRDGTVYVGSNTGCLYAFHPWLEKKWEYDGGVTPGPNGYGIFANPVIGPDGAIYCVRIGMEVDSSGNPHKDRAELHAIRPDKSPSWVWTENHLSLRVSPAIAGGRIYVAGEGGRIYAFRTADPSSNETSPPMNWEGDVIGGPVMGADRTVYVPNMYTLYAFPYHLAEPLWSWSTSSDNIDLRLWIRTPAVGADGRIYFGTWGNLGGGRGDSAHGGTLCLRPQ